MKLIQHCEYHLQHMHLPKNHAFAFSSVVMASGHHRRSNQMFFHVEIELLFERTSGEVDASLLTEDGRALMLGDAMSGGERLFADALAPGQYYLLIQGHTYTVENPYSFQLITTPISE